MLSYTLHMYALAITFKDGSAPPETLFVRRPQAIIGASEYAHVVVEDLKPLGLQFRVLRELGRRIRLKPLSSDDSAGAIPEKVYDNWADIDVGPLRFHLTALDSDLLTKENEPPDRAGTRVLRIASANLGPSFPAMVVTGAQRMVMSFSPQQPIYAGRAKNCALRLDSADISAQHARIGFENGEFWVEDLGSTNGTFVERQQVSGRVNVAPKKPIVLGRQIGVYGVTSQQELDELAAPTFKEPLPVVVSAQYPAIIAITEIARPARIALTAGVTTTIGRDPKCDMWLGAPHISRRHCSLTLRADGVVTVTDHSTNGLALEQKMLQAGQSVELRSLPQVLDFGSNVKVALCFNTDQEHAIVGGAALPQQARSEQIASKPIRSAAPLRSRSLAAQRTGLRFQEGGTMRGRATRLYRFLYRPGKGRLRMAALGCGLVLAFILVLLWTIFQ